MEKKRFYRNKILWKVLVTVIATIVFAILLYIFSLPKYAEYRIKNAKFLDVWCGDIMFQIDKEKVISNII